MTQHSGTELVFTRRFCMGHRLISCGSDQCAIPHGHNEYVRVALLPGPNAPKDRRLDGHGNMLVSFAEAKGEWHRFIDKRMDHGFQLSEYDPLLKWFAKHEPRRMERIIVTPGDPTTELMAALLMSKLKAFLKKQGDVLTIETLEIQETPTNTVRFHGDPAQYLPLVDRPAEDCWWNRADDSTLDAF